ncbi:hypothetical protein IIA15_01060 [candidate division TA06 bacterium]|nr:hypothetical protein [candidate division TA06 bacterium]
MTIIEDGNTGNVATVNSDNRLEVVSITSSNEHHTNHKRQKAFHLLFDVTPAGAGNVFLYVNNTNDKDLILEGITYRVASAEQVLLKIGVTGTPSGGSDIVPINCNAATAQVPEGTFQEGTNITGVATGNTVEKLFLENTSSEHFNLEQDVIIPPNSAFALSVVTGGVAISGTVVFNFHDADED